MIPSRWVAPEAPTTAAAEAEAKVGTEAVNEIVAEPAPATPELDTNDLGLRSVVAYKVGKAILQLLAGLALAGVVVSGNTDSIEGLAIFLAHHASGAWAVRSARFLVLLATPKHVVLAAVALILDSAMSGLEGWALHTRRWWAEWLVVIATGSLLPYELYHLVRHLRFGRAAIFVINIAIVIYLARRALHRPKAAKS